MEATVVVFRLWRLRWWSFDNGGYGGGLSIMEATVVVFR